MRAAKARALASLLALLGMIGALLSACTRQEVPPPAPTKGPGVPVAMSEMFKAGFQAPPRIRDLTGIASYSTAIDVSKDGDVNPPAGTPHFVVYLLLNDHNP